MREISIKTTTSANHRRKNLLIVETLKESGFVARAEKKYVYYVSEQTHGNDPNRIQEWMQLHSEPYKKKDRHVSIQKNYDVKTGIGKMIYRVIGSFYVVQNLHVFAVVFMHSIKFDMISGKFPAHLPHLPHLPKL